MVLLLLILSFVVNVVADATGLYFIFVVNVVADATGLYFIFKLETFVPFFSLPFVLCVKVDSQAANRSKHTGCMQFSILYRVSPYIPTTA